MLLKSEIAQQPAVISRLLDESAAATEAVAAAIRDFDPVFACIAARGTSDHAAIYAQYLFGAALQMPVMLATPSLHTVYARPPDFSKALVIGISQSGKAEDARAVLNDARAQGALTLAITNYEDSPLAAAAERHLPLRAEEEFSVAATKTYTAQLTVIAMLASALAGDEEMRSGLMSLPGLARETLDLTDGIAGWAQRYRAMDRLTVLGRGFNYATACEISLKVKELTYIASEGYSEADFRHGPIAVVQRGYPLILVAPQGKACAAMRDIFGVVEEKGAETLLISDDEDLLGGATQAMRIPAAPEWLSPIIAVMPGQVFAMRQALARGYEVDKPRGLSKVTITE
ncbi:MAG: SIS domain-containing protein [Chloroflexota bacterium]|nr:SIS domain-containing protein [Chloroflexota bacterium]